MTRGTTNGNVRGSSYDRRRRRAWLMQNYASDVPGFVRCYRCGGFLFNPDDHEGKSRIYDVHVALGEWSTADPLTVDRIIPGCQGGTYRRTNIRPACDLCNSETGGSTRRKK